MNAELFDEVTGEVLPVSAAAEAVRQAGEKAKKPIAGPSLGAALMAAMNDLPVWIKQDAEVNVTANRKMKYATLKKILETVRPVLLKHGIRIRQGAENSWTLETGGPKGRLVPVYTDLIHAETGEIDRTTVEIPVAKMDAQAMGSALSYGRRYSLLAALGLATDEADDDGAATKGRDLTEQHDESQELWVLKSEIDGIQDIAKLGAWGEKAKTDKRVTSLSEEDHLLLKTHFYNAMKALKDAPPAPDKKAKKE
jgi:hypothetical protein